MTLSTKIMAFEVSNEAFEMLTPGAFGYKEYV